MALHRLVVRAGVTRQVGFAPGPARQRNCAAWVVSLTYQLTLQLLDAQYVPG